MRNLLVSCLSCLQLVSFSVSGQNVDGVFEMRNNMLYLLRALDHEGNKQYTLQITAQDQGNPPPPLSTKITVMVNITGKCDFDYALP